MKPSPYKHNKSIQSAYELDNRNAYIKALQDELKRVTADRDNLRRLLKLDIQSF